MSIVALDHVTLLGSRTDLDEVVAALQNLGALHVVPLAPRTEDAARAVRSEALAALRYLRSAPIQRRPLRRSNLDAAEIERRALELQSRERDLRDEADGLIKKEAALAPWGDFALPPLGALGSGSEGPVRLWFYAVPTYRLPLVEQTAKPWSVVARQPGTAYVVVLSDVEPTDMPVPRAHTGDRSLSALRRRLETIREEQEALQFERADLARHRDRFAAHLDELLDAASRDEVAHRRWEDGPLFALAGWIPSGRASELQALTEQHRLALWRRAPGPDDDPPTLLHNEGLARAGQSLVTFYTTPGYFEWDPSRVVLLSFAVFFALILSDAGYALLLLSLLLVLSKRVRASWGRPLWLLALVTLGLSVAWGVAVGSYFGLEPGPASTLASLRAFDLRDHDAMMRLTVGIGAAHVIAANLIRAVMLPHSGALGAIGWCIGIATGLTFWLSSGTAFEGAVSSTAPALFALAGALILLFSSDRRAIGPRLADGARALARLTSAFGDVLSYLRLFALGLASSSLALAFNDLARGLTEVRGVGLLLAAFTLVVGHTINLSLAILGGFVHGLRLNFIEFFRWGTTTEGHPFRAFARRRAAEPRG